MPARIRTLTLLFTLVAACGGSPTATGPAGTGATPASTNAGPASSAPTGGLTTRAPTGPTSIAAPCTLLTAADIEQATGFEPIRQAPTTAPGDLPVGCEWELDGPADVPAAIVIGVRSPGGRGLSFSEGDPIQGLGDQAVQSEAAVVESIKGDTFVSVTYMEFPERAEVTVELARLIMAKV